MHNKSHISKVKNSMTYFFFYIIFIVCIIQGENNWHHFKSFLNLYIFMVKKHLRNKHIMKSFSSSLFNILDSLLQSKCIIVVLPVFCICGGDLFYFHQSLEFFINSLNRYSFVNRSFAAIVIHGSPSNCLPDLAVQKYFE